VSPWEVYLFSDKKQAWVHWTTGTFEEALQDVFDWQSGRYRGYSQIRLERAKQP
jgi:hypothetical protein